MFKEILHYTFKRPHAAFDISAFHHHGQAIAVGHSTDGAEPGSGACLFDGKTSRVHVPFSKAWRDLGAIKIEALARSDAEFLEKAHVLIEGHLSFSLVLLPDHTVAAYVLVSKESDGSTPGSASHDPFSTFTRRLRW